MSSAAELNAQIAVLKEKLRIAKQGLANLDPKLQMNRAIIARYQAEVNDIPGQISGLEVQLRALQGSNSAGNIVRDDKKAKVPNANEVAPGSELQVLSNGRIQPPPETSTDSNALRSPPEYFNDFGTDAELRPYLQTQATPPSGPRSVSDDAFNTPATPTTQGGVGAAGDDRSGSSVVSALNSIDFAQKIISQPNILDQYASYTYSASLYLVTKAN
jgi:hypothetical protein